MLSYEEDIQRRQRLYQRFMKVCTDAGCDVNCLDICGDDDLDQFHTNYVLIYVGRYQSERECASLSFKLELEYPKWYLCTDDGHHQIGKTFDLNTDDATFTAQLTAVLNALL